MIQFFTASIRNSNFNAQFPIIFRTAHRNAPDDIWRIFYTHETTVIFNLNQIITIAILFEVMIKVLYNILPFHLFPMKIPYPFRIYPYLSVIIKLYHGL